MSFRKNLFKNILVAGGFNYLAQIVTFIVSLVTSRLLLPADFGIVGLITVFSGFITVFADSGISIAVIRSGFSPTYHKGLNAIAILIGFLLCICTLILIYPISLFYENQSLIWPGVAIAFLFIVRSITIVPLAVLQKKLEFSYLGKVNFGGVLSSTLATIFFAWLGWRHWALIWPQFITYLTIFYLTRKKSFIPIGFIRKPLLVKCYVLTKKLIGSLIGFNLINYWSRNTDNLLVGKIYGKSELGIYNRAYMMLTLPLSLITGIFSSVLFPSLVKYKAEGGQTQQEYYFVLRIISLINIPVALILILIPRPFVHLLWGQNWIGVADLLPYFGLLVMTQTLLSTSGSILVLEGKEKQLMISGWVSAAFMVSGIMLGALISIKGIAEFYSLFYLLGVLPFNVYYVYLVHLKHATMNVLVFWVPKIILSVIIWYFIYESYEQWLLLSLIIWSGLILWDFKEEIASFKKILNVNN